MFVQIEDDIRAEEAAEQFGTRFIELARAVYITNDKRALIKKKIERSDWFGARRRKVL